MKNQTTKLIKLQEEITALQNEALEVYRMLSKDEIRDINETVGFIIADYSLDIDNIVTDLSDEEIAMCNTLYVNLNELIELKLKQLDLLNAQEITLHTQQSLLTKVNLLIFILTVMSDSEREFDCIESRDETEDKHTDIFEDLYLLKKKFENNIEYLNINSMDKEKLIKYIEQIRLDHKVDIEDYLQMLDKREEWIELQDEKLLLFESIDNWYNTKIENVDDNTNKLHEIYSNDYNSTKKAYQEIFAKRDADRQLQLKELIKGVE